MIEDFGNWKKEVRNIHKKQEKSCEKFENYLELRGIEPRTFHMRSEHSTTELQPRRLDKKTKKPNKKTLLDKNKLGKILCFAVLWVIHACTSYVWFQDTHNGSSNAKLIYIHSINPEVDYMFLFYSTKRYLAFFIGI